MRRSCAGLLVIGLALTACRAHETACTLLGGRGSVLSVVVPASVLEATVTVQVGLCQQDHCAHVVFPAAGDDDVVRVGSRFDIDLAGFRTAYDADHEAEVTVVLIGGPEVGGAALVRQSDDFRFQASSPNGKGCDPEDLSYTEVVTAAQPAS